MVFPKMPRELVLVALPLAAISGSAVWQARANAQLERKLEELSTQIENSARAAACAPDTASAERVHAAAQPNPPAAKSDEARQAFDDASRLIDAAIARHAWTPQDTAAIHAISPLTPRERSELRLRVLRAASAEQLTMTGDYHF